MRNCHVTKRIAPLGYVAVTKPLARELYLAQKDVTFCGNNVNSFHVFEGWQLGSTYCLSSYGPNSSFEDLVKNFLFYLEPELGRYVVFYTKMGLFKNEL